VLRVSPRALTQIEEAAQWCAPKRGAQRVASPGNVCTQGYVRSFSPTWT